jgi:predicted Ser/Thr protein kinase
MRRIDRYEIERELGRGAMGVVYLANDPRLHRKVALKTYALPDGVTEAMAKEFQARFLREAQAAAGLSHPGLVTIYDAGEDLATHAPFIAMEYVPGESLKQRLDRGRRLEPEWVLAMGAVLAEALHTAHRKGIVHRDIKPANILIREGDGAAKLADFGVARLKASELTQSGAFLGSPGYMSPEQIRGAAVDGRSDLFSLAVVLYEALSGKRPFDGNDLVSLAHSIAYDTQVPLSRQFPGCSAAMDRFFDRALEKDPAKRFADGAAFREAFVAAGRQPEAQPAAAAGVVAGAAVAGAAVARAAPGAVAGAAGNADVTAGGTVIERVPASTIPLGKEARNSKPVSAVASGASVLRAAAAGKSGNGSHKTPAIPPAAVASRKRRNWLGVSVAGALVAGLAIAGYMMFTRSAPLVAQGRPVVGVQTSAQGRPADGVPALASMAGQTSASANVRPESSGSSPYGAGHESPAPASEADLRDAVAQSPPHRTAAPPRETSPQRESAPPQTPPSPTRTLPQAPRYAKVTIPSGTDIALTLDAPLGSSSSQAGQEFTATVSEAVVIGGQVAVPAGSRLHGRVVEATPAKHGLANKAGSLGLEFDRVSTPAGFSAPLSATFRAEGDGSGKQTAAIIGGSTAGGALLNRLAGRHNAARASILGAALGTGAAAAVRGHDIDYPAGAALRITPNAPITIAIQN